SPARRWRRENESVPMLTHTSEVAFMRTCELPSMVLLAMKLARCVCRWLSDATDDAARADECGLGFEPRDVGSDYSTLMIVMTGVMLNRPLPISRTERSPSKSMRIFVAPPSGIVNSRLSFTSPEGISTLPMRPAGGVMFAAHAGSATGVAAL